MPSLQWGTKESHEFLGPYLRKSKENEIEVTYHDLLNGIIEHASKFVENIRAKEKEGDSTQAGLRLAWEESISIYQQVRRAELEVLPIMKKVKFDNSLMISVAKVSLQTGLMFPHSDLNAGICLYDPASGYVPLRSNTASESQLLFLAEWGVQMHGAGLTPQTRSS